jgi:RimJ/RimL family protein N-acetyltransferase
MDISANAAALQDIVQWRDMYRLEMACQVVHDSIHERRGWSDEYVLSVAGTPVGYGSVAVGGPWMGAPAAYEFYVVPHQRLRLFELFRALLAASGAVSIEVQSNDVLATTMLHTFAGPVTSESILFHDKVTTSHRPAGATFRAPAANEMPDVDGDQLRWHGVVEVEGRIAARGGTLFHYNRPYGDIFMETTESFRRRGYGSFLVQELKRVCYEGGHVPAARCNPDNIASRRTLQRAGFVPCGHILKGPVRDDHR